MADLAGFLRERNVSEEVIKKLEEDKIDHTVLPLMADETLKLYIPSYGDRIAANAFCSLRQETVTPTSETDSVSAGRQRSPLLNRLMASRPTSRRRRGHALEGDNPNKSKKSQNASKPTRRVNLGWMNFDHNSNSYRQVRRPNGGGTRQLEVEKSMGSAEILAVGTELFFPDGESKFGSKTGFIFSVMDSQLNDIGQNTIGQLYEKTKYTMLHLYICSKSVEGPSKPENADHQQRGMDSTPADNSEALISTDSDSDLPSINITTSTMTNPSDNAFDLTQDLASEENNGETGTPTVIFNREASRRRRRIQLRRPPRPLPEEDVQSGSSESNTTSATSEAAVASSVPSEVTAPDTGRFDQTTQEAVVDLTHEEQLFATQESNVKVEMEEGFRRLSGLLSGEQDITINREGAATELLRLYGDQDLMFKRVRVTFRGEPGDDFGGLTKDLYTVAWKGILEDYFAGEDSMTPYLPLHRQRKLSKNYVSIGRILSHTTALVQEIPARISRSTLIQIVFGREGVGEEILMEDFRLFLPPLERVIVEKALSSFSSLNASDRETLTSIFSVHGLLELPREAEIKEQILTMAEHELIHKPAPFISLMRKGIPDSHFEAFWVLLTNDSIGYIFNKQHPTPSKVRAVIQTEADLRAEEEASLHFLHQYISGLDSEELSEFLLFVTGATAMPEKLTVSFTNLTGLSRRPIAHTCSNVLELPVTYGSVQEMKREFKKLFANDYTFQMTAF